MKKRITTEEVLRVWPPDAELFLDLTAQPYSYYTKDYLSLKKDQTPFGWDLSAKFFTRDYSRVYSLKYLFDDFVLEEVTKEFTICFHERASGLLQRPDRDLTWWHYCKKCGDWLEPFRKDK